MRTKKKKDKKVEQYRKEIKRDATEKGRKSWNIGSDGEEHMGSQRR